MNNIRHFTRDLSIKERAGAMSALDRIKSDEYIEEFNRLLLLVNPSILGIIYLMLALIQLIAWIVINIPRRLVIIKY